MCNYIVKFNKMETKPTPSEPLKVPKKEEEEELKMPPPLN
jgi:hypothetical protein